jgi:hypothetical protein
MKFLHIEEEEDSVDLNNCCNHEDEFLLKLIKIKKK